MRLSQKQQSTMATDQIRPGSHMYPAYLQTQIEIVNREDRYGRDVKKTPSMHIPHPHLLFDPHRQEIMDTNLGAGTVVSKTMKKKKTANKIPIPEKVAKLPDSQCSTPANMANQTNQRYEWVAIDSENAEHSASEIYNSTQQQNNMTYPQANENLRQNIQKPGSTTTRFDLSQYNKPTGVNSNRNNGRNTTLVVLESSGTGASVPRQKQDTGQPVSKTAPLKSSVYQTPGKIPLKPDENPYMEINSDNTFKPLARKPEVSKQTKPNGHNTSNQAPSARTKYLNKPSEVVQIYSAQKSQKVSRSSSSIQRQNIFVSQKGSENLQNKIQQAPEQRQAGNMPFEMASTFISNSDAQFPQNWLAQKMHNNMTAHNDLSRKSVNSFQLDQSDTFTGRSIEAHNKPSSGLGENNYTKAHQKISAKIPAKVMPRTMAKGKELQWQSMQSVTVEPKNAQHETREQVQSYELSPASRLKGNMPIYSQPIRIEGVFRQRSDLTMNEVGLNKNQPYAKGPRQNLETASTAVNMQPNHGTLDTKRQSVPGPSLNTRANRPLATKYPVSGANGLNQKEPNKFPSNQKDNQIKYEELLVANHPTVNSQFVRNNAQYLNRDKIESDYRQAEMSIDKDVQANHPLLSKSQSGVKKRPSMHNNSNQMYKNIESEAKNDFVIIKGRNVGPAHEEIKQQQRSDSYFGRIQNFLGITKNQGDGSLDLKQKSKVNDVKHEVLSEQTLLSPLHQSLAPKLTLKQQQNAEDFLPVSSQKFESPMATKQLSSHRFKCTCEPSSEPYACMSAFKWLQMSYNGRKFEIQKSRKVYLDLLGIKDFISMAEERQIECDITRTFPQQQIFKEAQGEGQQALQRVLQAFSKYDATIGYVQGMNFIVGALLLHCSEEVTFWLFVALIEDYEMRDIYMEGLPGHIKHSTLITQLMEIHLAELYEHLQDIGMNIEIFATDWYFTLFAKVIPTSQMNAFFQNFFQFGWCFFHKFTLTLLRILAPQILQMDDMSEIKQLLLLPRHKQNFYGNNSSLMRVEEIKSESSKNPFPGTSDGNLEAITQQTQQRTFLSSIGNLFWPSQESRSSTTAVDTELQKLMGGASVEELLSKEDAWVEIIDISRNLWGLKLTDSAIKQFLNEYDTEQEKQKFFLMNQEAKFHDSQGRLSDAADYEKQGESDIVVMRRRDSNQTVKKQQSSNLAHKKKSSDSPLPQGASFSSNELDEDNLEYPTHELSPMKQVQESGMRMPKQTKLMFKNINSMRVMPQHTPRIDSQRQASDRPLEVTDFTEQFSRSQMGFTLPKDQRQIDLLASKREPQTFLELQKDFIRPAQDTQQVTGFDQKSISSAPSKKHIREGSGSIMVSPKEQFEDQMRQMQRLHQLQQHQALQAKNQIKILEERRRTIQPASFNTTTEFHNVPNEGQNIQ